MTQSAIVTRIIDSVTAEITVKRSSACSGVCSSCGSTCSVANRITVRAVNKICAAVGDSVTVVSQTGSVISAAALVYILPLATFFIGYALSSFFRLGEKLCIAVSLAAFFLGVLCVVLINRRFGQKHPVKFVIVSRE